MMIVDKDGTLINAGPWDYKIEAVLYTDANVPATVEERKAVGEGPLPPDWELRDVVTNPLPDGARAISGDVLLTAEGRAVLPTDYIQLRRSAYLTQWPIEKQLEAWADDAGGNSGKKDAMLAAFAAIKQRYPAN